MTNSKGVRRGTRDMFSRKFRKHGVEHLKTYLRTYKVGDYVDIKGNGAFHNGMPHKKYHGNTGRIFNVTKRCVGVVIYKRVRGSIKQKKLDLRIEHVRPSRCQEDLKRRIRAINKAKAEAFKQGIDVRTLDLKRKPKPPRSAHYVNMSRKKPIFLAPIPYEFMA